MKKILLVLTSLFLLSGCSTDTNLIHENRSFKVVNQDRHLAERAQTLIDRNKKLKGRTHISVAAFNHILLMVGQAQTPELRSYAQALITNNLKNIRRIYNEINVAGSSSFLQRTSDSWITTKVRTAMLTAKNLHSSSIKVITEASTVYLMGLTRHSQGVLATNVARRVQGVKRVVKVFQYI